MDVFVGGERFDALQVGVRVANWLGVHPLNPVTDGVTAAATWLIPGVGLLNGGGL